MLVTRAVLIVTLLALAIAGCGGREATPPALVVPDGVPDRGADAIAEYGWGSCHHIPGIREAQAYVAPPLDRFGRRAFIAGRLPNTPENLIRWIQDPQEVDPENAMPDLDVSEAEARDTAAYLLELR
jgi:cytochrome c